MLEDVRFNAALTAARELVELEDLPLTPDRLSKFAYTILEAMYEAERQLAVASCRVDCPRFRVMWSVN